MNCCDTDRQWRKSVVVCMVAYAEFGDEQTLHQLTVDQYVQNDVVAALVPFECELDIRTAVKAFMKAALALVDIRLLDHLIIGDGETTSLSARGLV